jgi:[protein-PII] uridylyltransferase
MNINIEIRENFLAKREKLFREHSKQIDPLKFSRNYSFLVEETIREVAGDRKYNFALTSAGSFSRRELSPYSDIDLIFINENIEENERDISGFITMLWDSGLEVSHTIREFADINKYLLDDLHTFTQFFETRFLLGSDMVYNKWNEALIDTISESVKLDLLKRMIEDIKNRYSKYGDSPKVLEPNVKLSAGGLRDLQTIEWMYIIIEKSLFNKQQEITQTEAFLQLLTEENIISHNESKRLLASYKIISGIRNLLHLSTDNKTDRLEFSLQIKIAEKLGFSKSELTDFMRIYFKAAIVINRFSKSIVKKYFDEIIKPIPSSLAIILDDDFELTGRVLSLRKETTLTLSDILRAFYYRGLYSARFDSMLRGAIINKVESVERPKGGDGESSVFFREILKLRRNVGSTLSVMNELGVLETFMPEFTDLNGFLQHGVYHCYTADEHTLIAIKNVEKLENQSSLLGKIFDKISDKEILYLALIFHDIAKPINLTGHEIIGAEMASSVMHRLGYSEDEISQVCFLVRNHLIMEQTAFRRNLNDPETLNNFTSLFNSIMELDLLYLVSYADLSAVNPAVWTSWKSELLAELYRKSKAMLEDKISGEELLVSATSVLPADISKYSNSISESHVKDHIDSINDLSYSNLFSAEEIAKHIEEINKGNALSVMFTELNGFTNITVITRDFFSLLAKICGVLAINDVNIHDAKIFTRKDGIVIDTFNVTDFRTHKKIDKERYEKIESDLNKVLKGLLRLRKEIDALKSKWWRVESKLFKRTGQIKIAFEKHEKYTIIDIFSPDRLGFLYLVTSKMNELGLNIYFAKISTRGDDIVDSFYVLNESGKKISQNDYELIKSELTSVITKIL